MKKATILLLSAFSLLFAACEKEGGKLYNVAIDVQSDFDHDNVKVFIDNQVEVDMQATTNHVLGFAGSATTTRNSGNHQIKVVVNNNVIKTAVFPLNGNLYIGVAYLRDTDKINIQYSNQPFPYD